MRAVVEGLMDPDAGREVFLAKARKRLARKITGRIPCGGFLGISCATWCTDRNGCHGKLLNKKS